MTITMIEELRRLEAEATPGPWKTDGTFIENKTHILATSYHPENCERDAALIVAMRNALPELLSQHEQLIERVLRYATDYVPRKDLEEAQAENASLRRVNKALGNMLEPHGGVDVG